MTRYYMNTSGRVDRIAPQESTQGYTPVVVIDPEDREQVTAFRRACPDEWGFEADEETRNEVDAHLQAALRSLIAPSKPEEPLGLGAVVEDAKGVRWTRVNVGCWVRPGHGLAGEDYDAIAAVRVLSTGVQP